MALTMTNMRRRSITASTVLLFGVQSFDTKVRRAAKRLDEREAVLERLSALSRGNQAPIIVDLLFGLPFQDEARWQRDIRDFLDSGAHGVDLYQLIEMNGTPMERLVGPGQATALLPPHHRRRGCMAMVPGHWRLPVCNA